LKDKCVLPNGCCQKRGLPTRCLVTGQSSVERESSVELLHFCDNQTPFSSAHHKLLLDAGHPSILISDWFRGYLGASFLGRISAQTKWKPIPLFCPHLASGFPSPFVNSVHFFSRSLDHQDLTIRIQFVKSHFTAIGIN